MGFQRPKAYGSKDIGKTRNPELVLTSMAVDQSHLVLQEPTRIIVVQIVMKF